MKPNNEVGSNGHEQSIIAFQNQFETQQITHSPSWIEENHRIAVLQKSCLAMHAAKRVISNLSSVLSDHGTSFNAVFDKWTGLAVAENRPKAVEILTPSLSLFELLRDAQLRDPSLFSCLKTTLTGGSVHRELHCLCGDFAVRGINADEFEPTCVLLGAYGLYVEGDNIVLAYAFPEERTLKRAIALRPTGIRYIMCDSSKFGRRAGWRVSVSLKEMLANASGVVIITNSIDLAENKEVFQSEVEAFQKLFDRVAAKHPGKTCEIRLVNQNGDVERVPVRKVISAGNRGPVKATHIRR